MLFLFSIDFPCKSDLNETGGHLLSNIKQMISLLQCFIIHHHYTSSSVSVQQSFYTSHEEYEINIYSATGKDIAGNMPSGTEESLDLHN